MDFSCFIDLIPKIKCHISDAEYCGLKYQLKMKPLDRLQVETPQNHKKAGVLILIYPKNRKTYLLLTLRASYKGTHSAQISFPGGKKDIVDKTLLETALRETEEEVGVPNSIITPIIKLTNIYIPSSNFLVTPHISYSKTELNFSPNYEVDKIIEVSIADLLNDKFITTKNIATSTKTIKVPCFMLNDHLVWGATAAMLSELRSFLKIII